MQLFLKSDSPPYSGNRGPKTFIDKVMKVVRHSHYSRDADGDAYLITVFMETQSDMSIAMNRLRVRPSNETFTAGTMQSDMDGEGCTDCISRNIAAQVASGTLMGCCLMKVRQNP